MSFDDLDLVAAVFALVVGALMVVSFDFEGLGWDLIPVWSKIVLLFGGMVVTYFVSSAMINN